MTKTSTVLACAGLTVKHLELVATLFEAGSGYQQFEIRKRSRSARTIYQARAGISSWLKSLQQALAASDLYDPPGCVHGYVKGRGIRTNAEQHLSRDVVLCLDLEDFFPSIDTATVEKTLTDHGLDAEGADLLARATTIEGKLATGLSTSPLLSNIAFHETDLELIRLAKDMGLTYTRFADDLTFSGTFGEEILDQVVAVLNDGGWTPNNKKTRFMRRGKRQYVTGLYVGSADQPHAPRHMKRLLRQRLHYMAKYGFEDVLLRGKGEEMFANRAAGWVRYINQTDSQTASRLEAKFDEVDFSGEYLYWGDPDDWDKIVRNI